MAPLRDKLHLLFIIHCFVITMMMVVVVVTRAVVGATATRKLSHLAVLSFF